MRLPRYVFSCGPFVAHNRHYGTNQKTGPLFCLEYVGQNRIYRLLTIPGLTGYKVRRSTMRAAKESPLVGQFGMNPEQIAADMEMARQCEGFPKRYFTTRAAMSIKEAWRECPPLKDIPTLTLPDAPEEVLLKHFQAKREKSSV